MKRVVQTIVLAIFLVLLIWVNLPEKNTACGFDGFKLLTIEPIPLVRSETVTVKSEYISAPIEALKQEMTSGVLIEPEEDNSKISEEDIELIALVTMAEAEGESEEGKRWVIDVILNRMESELSYFPDTVHDVVYQKNAFSVMWGENPRINRVDATDEVRELVREEIENRTNDKVLYFRTKHYSKYGTPIDKVGNHYFSGV